MPKNLLLPFVFDRKITHLTSMSLSVPDEHYDSFGVCSSHSLYGRVRFG